jgi:hypothetical protein
VPTERRDDLVVILAGQAGQLRGPLRARPALASRSPATVDFPGYTARQLAMIFATLAGEAGFTLTPSARERPRMIGPSATARPRGPGVFVPPGPRRR